MADEVKTEPVTTVVSGQVVTTTPEKVVTEPVKTETTETVVVDDVDAKLDAMYKAFEKANKEGAETTTVTADPVIETKPTSRVINTMEDYKRWKEEEPEAAEAWMVRTVSEATYKANQAKDQRRVDSETWTKNERAVLAKHHKAIKADGSVDTEDPWIKAYIQIGKENPYLMSVPNGPLMAEAMADKITNEGSKGRDVEAARVAGAQEEAARQEAALHANTGASTTTRPVTTTITLSPTEQAMATRFKMTPAQWVAYSQEKVISKIHAPK